MSFNDPAVRQKIKRALGVLWIVAAVSLLAVAITSVFFKDSVGTWVSGQGIYTIFTLGVVLAFVAEYIDSSLGMGFGTTLTPVLLLMGFEPMQVVPAVLLQELVSGTLAATSHHSLGNADFRPGKSAFKIGAMLGICGLAGGAVAAHVALGLPEATIKAVTGGIVIAMGIVVIGTRRVKLKFSWGRTGALGIVAAFNKGFMGGGYGPIVTAGQMVSGGTARQAVAVTSVSEMLTCAGALAMYVGQQTPIHWPLALGMLAGGAFAAVLGAATVRAMPAKSLTKAVGIGCLLLGGLTLLKLML